MRTMNRAAVILMLALLSLWGSAPRATAETNVVRVIDYRIPTPVDAALAMGYFDAEGIVVQKVGLMEGAADALQALAAGSSDGSVTAVMPFVTAVSKGVPAIFVIDMNRSTPEIPAQDFVVLKDSAIQGVQDLRGKKIAVNALGTYMDLYLRVYLRRHGLDPDRDVTILPMPWHVQEQALFSKQIDVLGAITPFAPRAIKKGARPILRDAFGTQDVWGYYLATKFIEANPNTTRKFVRAVAKGIKFLQKEPEKAAELIAKMPGKGNVETILLMLPSYRNIPPHFRMDLKSIEEQQDILLKAGLLRKKVDVKDIFTDRFLPAPADVKID